jgi:hypothetical protein
MDDELSLIYIKAERKENMQSVTLENSGLQLGINRCQQQV